MTVLGGNEGMAAKVEETVLDTYGADAQEALPHFRELFLDGVARGDVAFQIGAFKALARACGLCRGLVGLRDQGVERHGGDQHLATAQSERTAQGFGAFGGADALADEVGEAFLGGCHRRVCAVVIVEGDFLCRERRGVGEPAFKALHGEVFDLDQHVAFGVRQGDVEGRVARTML